MKEKGTSTKFARVLAFFLIFSIIISCFYGCGDDEDESPGGNASASNTQQTSNEPGSTEDNEPGSSTDSSSASEQDSTSGKTSGTSGGTSGGTSSQTPGKTNSVSRKPTGGSGNPTAPPVTTTKKPPVQTTKSNTYYAPRVYSNSAPGTLTFSASDGSAVVDYSNASQGYIMIKYSGAFSNIRVIVTAPGGSKPQYPIFSKNNYEAIPLTSGSGTYQIGVYGNNGGTSYYPVVTGSVNASLSYSTAPFIRPNMIVNYNSSTSCVQYAATLTRGCDTDLAKVEAIYKYVVKNISYDHNKAASVANTAYVPNLNSVWSSKKGICYDYAAVMAAMLRTQGIPTKVQAGYVSGQYHAWISTYINGSGWIDNIIYFNGTSWKLMDPTFASTGGIGYDWSKKCSYSVMYNY